jgi:hypothetical protein
MESSTFLSVVNDILDNFDDICESINYIQKIDNMLSRISIQEEKENESKIQSIFDFIKEELTSAQVKKLHSQLKTYRDYPECKIVNYGGMLVLPGTKCWKGFENIPVRKDDDDTLNDALDKIRHHTSVIKQQPVGVLKATNYNGNEFIVPIKKLDSEDDEVISEVVFLLLTELGSNSGSGLTIPVYNYFEVIEGILESDVKRYEPITNDIKMCLIKHGWKCKNENTVGGFHTQPNKVNLTDDLTMIINKYF